MLMLTYGGDYATEKPCVQHLFIIFHQLIQRAFQPTSAAKLDELVPLRLSVGAPGHRGGPGWRRGAAAPSRLPPLMLLETESCGHTVHGTARRTPAPL